jgi:hypothetical protein
MRQFVTMRTSILLLLVNNKLIFLIAVFISYTINLGWMVEVLCYKPEGGGWPNTSAVRYHHAGVNGFFL